MDFFRCSHFLLRPSRGQTHSEEEILIPKEEEAEMKEEYARGAELIATAHTQEDADLIAELYGVTLVRWTGLAVSWSGVTIQR